MTTLSRNLLWLYLPALAVLMATVALSLYLDQPFSHFSRDPLAVTRGYHLYGLLSNLGAILWAFATAVALLAYSVLRESDASEARFFLTGGLLSGLLLLDDLFMLHEKLYPALGMGEKRMLVVYGLLGLGYLYFNRGRIRQSEYGLLVAAMALFALSIGVDRLPKTWLSWHHLWEDGAKFIGICSWFGYQLQCARQALLARSGGRSTRA
ncbi:hypothetical protein [Ferrimonas balearica]|uniref:hypothetical protein n=1 Tax=Ferrimonas balearica TaxID=44012 RepID=UPI001C99688F|nr:hypothetical protein [Ferrimonas balearica]MBY5991243.1 hypothetical protein [Ferrimonas balearica]